MQACSTASPNGEHIAFVRSSLLCRQSTRTREPALTGGRKTFENRDVTSIKWARNGRHVLITCKTGVKVLDIDDFEDLASVGNGGGGWGKISTADFIGNDWLLVTWEFGKTSLWDLKTGKAGDLPDVKTTCEGTVWQSRPGSMRPALLALLSRVGTEDHLLLYFSSLSQSLSCIKLATADAQSLSWSPDGRWLAILDTPSVSTNLHIHTSEGHRFRSCPTGDGDEGLGIKSIAWSPDGRILALAKYDNRVELLNTRTFSPLAIIEHHTTISQTTLPVTLRAPVWQENVSSTKERTYTFAPHPISPPLSARTKPSPDLLTDQGICELVFSCDGSYLATRDARMANTIWIWDAASLSAQSVLLQHSHVRRLLWHPTRARTLLVDSCSAGVAHVVCDVASSAPPVAHRLDASGPASARLSWLHTPPHAPPVIMIAHKTHFRLLYPEGPADDDDDDDVVVNDGGAPRPAGGAAAAFEDGASEDSLFDVLSGRKPLPPKTAMSYTEMVDVEVESGEDASERLVDERGMDDTFRGKKRNGRPLAEVIDPFDDSEIF